MTVTTNLLVTLDVLERVRRPRLFGLGHGRVWVLLAVLVVILVIVLVQRRNR